MKLAYAAVAALMLPLAANAATITVEDFDSSAYTAAVGAGTFVGEDFEAAGGALGEGEVGTGFMTAVGIFNTLGGQGSGGTVSQLPGNTGEQLALRDGNVYGRTDQVGGTWFLDSNDTYGMGWYVNTGSMFNTIMFVLTDHSEYSTLTVTADGMSQDIARQAGSSSDLVTVTFDGLVSAAYVQMQQARNDGFSIDGAQVGIAPVPLPAAGLMLLAGLGGMAAMRRFKRDDA
ncbi:MAG: VPLPA-CTERM sorting domain-containing protein [Pseudomonadota bacterium]